MLHSRRTWVVSPVESAEELARKLTSMTWCLCTAFELGGYLWLNDTTSEDGAQEYAVLKTNGPHGTPVQIESITFSWCDEAKTLSFIRHTLSGGDDDNSFRRDVTPALQSPAEHGTCRHCA